MRGSIIQVNVSRGGVPKLPVAFGLVTPGGIIGDACAHPRYHGGPLQAVLLIANEAIEELKALGYPVYPGALGENLTSSGLDPRTFWIGQRYRAGTATIELTKIRVPCKTLDVFGPGIQRAMYDSAVKRGDVTSRVWGVSGVYASVVEAGEVRPGDVIALTAPAAATL